MESALGKIEQGWSDPESKVGIQIVAFANTPQDGVTTYSTLGLNKHLLSQTSGTEIRHELLTSVEVGASGESMANLLLTLAEHIVEEGSALSRGQVVTPGFNKDESTVVSGFYCTEPSPLSSKLTQFSAGDTPLIFVYLIGLVPSEISLVRDRGWRWFEEELEKQDPNVWDLSRTECITAE
jgi:hypothetical protein